MDDPDDGERAAAGRGFEGPRVLSVVRLAAARGLGAPVRR
jgi:hypothetical protein